MAQVSHQASILDIHSKTKFPQIMAGIILHSQFLQHNKILNTICLTIFTAYQIASNNSIIIRECMVEFSLPSVVAFSSRTYQSKVQIQLYPTKSMVVNPKLTSMMSPRTFSWLNKLTNFLLPRALTSRLRTTSHLKCSSHRLRLKAKDSSLPLRVDRPARSIGLSILWPYTVAIPIKTLLQRISHICLRAWLTI